MRVTVIPIKELTDDLKESWLKIQASNYNLAGPCFHPDLFIAIGKSLPNIYVSIVREQSNIMGFLPFLKNINDPCIAEPIPFCDYQAIISSQHQHWKINKILKGAGLNTWKLEALVDFDNLAINKKTCKIMESPRVDLRNGFKVYSESLKEKRTVNNGILRKRRLIERRIGPLNFVPVCNDINVIYRMLDWKKDRFNRSPEWKRLATELLEFIFSLSKDSFSGVLSALYAGDELLSSTFCLKYKNILYYLVVSLNPLFLKYSPGTLLISDLITELNTLQCEVLDFGPGGEPYKLEFSNNSLPFIAGAFKRNSFKEKIKSINWLYQGIVPVVRLRRRIISHKCI